MFASLQTFGFSLKFKAFVLVLVCFHMAALFSSVLCFQTFVTVIYKSLECILFLALQITPKFETKSDETKIRFILTEL